MTAFSTRILPFALLGVVVALVVSVVAYSVFASGSLPEGPVDVVWDKAACSACGMHVGEPPFAAQLTTNSGKTHAFDDPGCLFLYIEQQRPEVHSMWFHHSREQRWIAADAVAFAAAKQTPMGFGIAAVDAGTAGAIGLDEARRKVLGRDSKGAGK